MEAIFGIVIIFILFLIAYKLIRKLVSSDFRKSIISGELNESSSKMTIKLRDWFIWNVQVNNEKGTAGGNIKINFPIKSALLMGLVCAAVAAIAQAGQVSFIVTLIFLSFAIYHFRKWHKSFKFISAQDAFDNIKRLTRNPEKKYIGGVSSGIHERYQISLLLIRTIFVGLIFIGGIGIYIYLLLWIILPIKPQPLNLIDVS